MTGRAPGWFETRKTLPGAGAVIRTSAGAEPSASPQPVTDERAYHGVPNGSRPGAPGGSMRSQSANASGRIAIVRSPAGSQRNGAGPSAGSDAATRVWIAQTAAGAWPFG